MRGYAVKTLFVVAGVSTLIGCSSVGVHSQARGASDAATRDAELTALRVENDEQEQELRTLRGQLALARAEVQELKGEKELRAEARGRRPAGDELPWAKDGRSARHGPVLRLDGEVVDERLPITATCPTCRVREPQPAQAPQLPEVSVEGYRRGLSLIREQKFQEALSSSTRSRPRTRATRTPTTRSSGAARSTTCGTSTIVRFEYFERIEKLHPWGNKAPDALYRMGQIYLRRGDTARAQAYFDKVREQFPDTAAARLALREDAS